MLEPNAISRWSVRAIYKKDFDMVKFLVDHGADVHAGGDNALFFAIERKNIDDVKFIVEHGANTNAQIKDSKCALNFCCTTWKN